MTHSLPAGSSDYWDTQAAGHSSKAYRSPTTMNAIRLRLTLEELERLLPLTSGLNVLDAGCGDGQVAKTLYEKGWNVCGCDISPKMIQNAIEEFKKIEIEGREKARFLVTSVEQLEQFPDSSFDAIVSLGVLYYLRDERRALAEFNRVLKPGGILIITQQNAFFHMSTFNKYTIKFFQERVLPLLPLDHAQQEEVLIQYTSLMTNPESPKLELPGSARGIIEMRDEIPFSYAQKLIPFGFKQVGNLLFHGFHGLPPIFRDTMPNSYASVSSELDYEMKSHPLSALLSTHFLVSFQKA